MGRLLEAPPHSGNAGQTFGKEVFGRAKLLPANSPCLLPPRAPCLRRRQKREESGRAVEGACQTSIRESPRPGTLYQATRKPPSGRPVSSHKEAPGGGTRFRAAATKGRAEARPSRVARKGGNGVFQPLEKKFPIIGKGEGCRFRRSRGGRQGAASAARMAGRSAGRMEKRWKR